MRPSFLDESTAILERTPSALKGLLRGLPDAWTKTVDGEGTWSPYSVVGHLIHAEKHNWIPRVQMILEHGEGMVFPAFEPEGMLREDRSRPVDEMLDEFAAVRANSLKHLLALDLSEADLGKRGRHPAFGPVTLRQLMATWTAHDLGHLVQVNRTLARRYREEVGPWAEYLSVMR